MVLNLSKALLRVVSKFCPLAKLGCAKVSLNRQGWCGSQRSENTALSILVEHARGDCP